jgi:Rrf2 family transcriptional regulator, iron-sulfur cluster assembly transcription factor
MRLEITRRADLAVRAMVSLARADGRVKATDLASTLGTTAGFVPQVVGPLVKRGWVRSDPGPTGGYSATVSLADVSVLQVIEAVDGPTDQGRCVVADRQCGGGPFCALHAAWGTARLQLLRSLDATPLTDVTPGRGVHS